MNYRGGFDPIFSNQIFIIIFHEEQEYSLIKTRLEQCLMDLTGIEPVANEEKVRRS